MVEISFAAAFLGGVLSLLSPCSALLLPAFFAYAFQSRRDLTARTFIFYLGLATIFVPLGMGASLASFLFLDNRETMITVAGVLLIAFGVLELAGRSLGVLRMPSGGASDAQGLFGTYSLGMVYGFGGFCSGPILGSVLTVAATDDNPLHGGALLAVYALGTVIPLFILALVWDRLDLGKRRLLRGFGVEMGPLRVHSTNLIAGTLFILLGASFILLNGTNALSATYADLGFEEASYEADVWIRDATAWLRDEVLIVAGAALGIGGAMWLLRRMQHQQPAGGDPAAVRRSPAAPGERD